MKRRDLLKAAMAAPFLSLWRLDSLASTPGLASIVPHKMQNAVGKRPRVRLVAPSGWPVDPGVMKRGVERLRKAGFVVEGTSVLRRIDTRFGGTDAQRVGDINALATMHRLPDVVLATRGGYGMTRILPYLHYGALRERLHGSGMAWVGQSDFTALQLALYTKSGLITFAGPLLSNLGADPLEKITWKTFCNTLGSASHRLDWRGADAKNMNVHGPLWGGNLTMLCSLVGTPYFPRIDGGILFVEDVGEAPFRVERMLYQLYLSGVLNRQRVLVLGDFIGARTDTGDHGYNIHTAFDQIKRLIRVPLVHGLPHGHGRQQQTLPFGAPAHLRVSGDRASLVFSGYPRPFSIT